MQLIEIKTVLLKVNLIISTSVTEKSLIENGIIKNDSKSINISQTKDI